MRVESSATAPARWCRPDQGPEFRPGGWRFWRHVSHVLGKLGAANRTEAVARARELSLIP